MGRGSDVAPKLAMSIKHRVWFRAAGVTFALALGLGACSSSEVGGGSGGAGGPSNTGGAATGGKAGSGAGGAALGGQSGVNDGGQGGQGTGGKSAGGGSGGASSGGVGQGGHAGHSVGGTGGAAQGGTAGMAATGGSGGGSGDGSGGGSGTGSGGGNGGSTFGAVQAIFNARCVRCHDPAHPVVPETQTYVEMPLVAGMSYAALVSQAAHETCGGTRVLPGQPEKSYLYRKVVDASPCDGKRMPHQGMLANTPPLPDGEIATIRDWIAAGAKP